MRGGKKEQLCFQLVRLGVRWQQSWSLKNKKGSLLQNKVTIIQSNGQKKLTHQCWETKQSSILSESMFFASQCRNISFHMLLTCVLRHMSHPATSCLRIC